VEFILARWITFAATLIATGSCTIGMRLIPRSTANDATRRQMAADAARFGLFACCALIAASLVRLLDQLLALRSPGDALAAGLRPLLFSTTWGSGFLAQMLALAMALAGFAAARRAERARWPWWCAAAGAVGLSVTLSLQGHAIGNEQNTLIAVLADATHVLAAGLWIGSICVIGLLGMRARDDQSTVTGESADRGDTRLRLLVPLVSPLALTGAALIVLSGVVSSLLQLRDVMELWSTAWGRFVAFKVVLLIAVAALGARNWRTLGPRLESSDRVRVLRRTLVAELALAALVLLVTSILVVTPLPGE
jgi:copper transport protein